MSSAACGFDLSFAQTSKPGSVTGFSDDPSAPRLTVAIAYWIAGGFR